MEDGRRLLRGKARHAGSKRQERIGPEAGERCMKRERRRHQPSRVGRGRVAGTTKRRHGTEGRKRGNRRRTTDESCGAEKQDGARQAAARDRARGAGREQIVDRDSFDGPAEKKRDLHGNQAKGEHGRSSDAFCVVGGSPATTIQ